MDFVKFGWQGIFMELPANWELGGLSGDYDSGYIRMDDESMPRMELKWSRAKEKKPDLQKILDEYFKGMRKRLGARDGHVDPPLQIKRNINLIKNESFFENRDTAFYNWKSDVRANGVIWHCRECKRIVVVQIMGKATTGTSVELKLLPLTLRILESVRDHPAKASHTNLWSAYQLTAEVPRRYHLEKQKLMSGYLLLSFVDGSRLLNVERYGLADVTLKDTDLESWFRGYYSRILRKYGFSFKEIKDSDESPVTHHRMEMLGQEKRLIDNLPLSPIFAMDKVLRRKQIAARFWHCRESNRIFVVMAISKRDAAELVSSVASSIQCHKEGL